MPNLSILNRNMKALLCFNLLSASLIVSEIQEAWFAMEGEAYVVECPNTKLQDTVTWYFAGMSISLNKSARVHSSGIELWFLPTSVEDSGKYMCLKQMYPPNETETVTVTILSKKEDTCYRTLIPYGTKIGSPKSGKIACPTFDEYNNASDIKWYKDCVYLQGSKYAIYEKYLYIAGANENDTGMYACQFTYNYNGKKFNVTATRNFAIGGLPLPKGIQIHYPKDNEVIDVEIGASKNLSCKAWLGLQNSSWNHSYWKYNSEKDPNRFKEYTHSYVEPQNGHFIEAVLSIQGVREEDLGLNFTCVTLNDVQYRKVSVTLRIKQKGQSNISLIVGHVIILVIITALVALYHFFRVDLVLLYRRIFNYTESKDDGKIYDAYVIYPTYHLNDTSENNFVSSFVHQILPEVLENQCGYKLCIYGRDVLPGEDAADAVDGRIRKSRRLIIPLTKSLATSDFFGYEGQIALYNALIRNSVKVILLEMEKMGDDAQFQESLRHIISQQSTIKWKGKYMACPSSPGSAFWKHVQYQMPPRPTHSTEDSFVHISL